MGDHYVLGFAPAIIFLGVKFCADYKIRSEATTHAHTHTKKMFKKKKGGGGGLGGGGEWGAHTRLKIVWSMSEFGGQRETAK